ncbi:MAG: hypothetical protein ACJASV_002198 [Pseudorhodobacter sp.]|jgi:hypothetical protein
MRGGQAVTTAADHDDIVMGLRFRVTRLMGFQLLCPVKGLF